MVQFRPTIETTIFITHECATYLGVMYDKPCLNLTFVLAEWISMSMWMEIWYNISTHVHCTYCFCSNLKLKEKNEWRSAYYIYFGKSWSGTAMQKMMLWSGGTNGRWRSFLMNDAQLKTQKLLNKQNLCSYYRKHASLHIIPQNKRVSLTNCAK